MRNFSLHNTKLTRGGNELDRIVEIIRNKENKYYIMGTENEINSFYERTGKYLESIKALVSEKSNLSEFLGKPIIPEADVPISEPTIVICAARERGEYEAVRDRWQEKGIMENRQLFQGELFSMIYDVYERNQIRIDRIEIFLTSRCTLNCEKCIAYIPYVQRKEDIPLTQLKSDADILFQKVDYVYKLKLLGGEGLIYPDLIEYADYLHSNYGNKIGTIRIGTNGTIMPNQSILEMCKRDNVTLDISDYSMAVPEVSKINEIRELCEKNGVSVDIKRTGESWLDLGFPNDVPEKKDEEQLMEHFFKCAMFCRQFSQGRMWFCCTNFSAVWAGLFPESEDDYFDFNRDFSKRELLEYELGYNKLGHTTFCNVCRGCSMEVNPCQVRVAEQKKRG